MDEKGAGPPGIPPWKGDHGYPLGSLFWKMGAGEEYLNKWMDWFLALPPDARMKYLDEHEAPPDWRRMIGHVTGEIEFEIDWGDDK